MKMSCKVVLIMCLFYCIYLSAALTRYSKEANLPVVEEEEDWRKVDRPFRLAKINLVWTKAQKRLNDPKLKTLFSELKVQDKEELQLKRLKADNLDKDGLQEAALRKKFGSIISRYGLAEHFDGEGPERNEATDTGNHFKDKRLNKLWLKAESSGFTEKELKALREEFIHHQDKVDQFYSILEAQHGQDSREKNQFSNQVLEELQSLDNNKEPLTENHIVNLREKNADLKNAYDKLERRTLSGPNNKEFEEDKVQALWRIAQKADFNREELESLKTELRHYEQRLQKLRYLQAQQGLKKDLSTVNKTHNEAAKDLDLMIKHQARKVDKLHNHLETKITQRHLEL